MHLRSILLPALVAGSLLAQPAEAPVNRGNPGQTVVLRQFLRPNRTNLVDFFSEFCPPCMRISPLLQELAKKRPDLNVVKLDINRPGIRGIDWGSPLARQFNLQSIPHFKIFDGRGKLLKEGDPAFQQVIDWLKAAGLGDES